MRLHRLEVEAFGPFAGPTSIDFDTLSEAGLFLLSGATGAGKTSVLDAVCFALYGDVPGERAAAKRLRCDQAAPGVAPRVVLETTIGLRRFRLERSPAWERPKKRGTGLTSQQASVTVSELCDGAWTPLSSRLDETGDLMGRLLGMNLTQFTQVALLPQGRFQTFLRARSEERHQLLQQLFRTGRFAEVERWLRERRVALGRADAEAHEQVADVVSRISEATGRALPEPARAPEPGRPPEPGDLRDAVDTGALTPWAAHLLAEARRHHGACQEAASAAARAEALARAALETGRAESARRARHAAARLELARLEEGSAAHARAVARLVAAHRAAPVVPLHTHARARASLAEELEADLGRALDTVADHLGLPERPSPAALSGLTDDAVAAVAQARAALPRAARRVRASADLASLRQQEHRVADELAETRSALELVPRRVEGLRHDAAEARAAQERLGGLVSQERVLLDRAAAHRDVVRLTREAELARAEWLLARESALSLREELLDLQQARIEGMAAELAGALASGCSCPVCGSAEHPAKAAPAPGAPDARAEKRARTRVDDASMVEHAFSAKLHELETGLAAARARAGSAPTAELEADLAALRDRVRSADATAAGLPELTAALHDAEEAHRGLVAAAGRHDSRLAALRAEQAALRAEVEALEAEVEALLAPTPFADLGDLVAHGDRAVALCREALALADRRQVAVDELTDATAAAARCAAEAGFTDPEAALATALPAAEVQALASATEHHRTRVAAVREVLAEPGADASGAGPLPDVAALEETHVAALEQREATAADQHVATTTLERLTGLAAQLDGLLGPWVALRADLDLTTRLAGFVEGTSADNPLRMRLSAYVLAYRLGQVVAAANERLARMSDQRYSLEHTGRRGAGETRGGLSLLVRDDWSGESRDPATLSGGETFVVSLALALGLSDVVTGETGGAALDTLFVDEGFGSLDADTLDDVMDTLDSLRDGGRVVGLVSHVAEMRDRIPTQLVVTKARGGSSVRLVGC